MARWLLWHVLVELKVVLVFSAGKKTLRDFQECRKFLDPTTVDGQGSIASSTAYRKRQRKVRQPVNLFEQSRTLHSLFRDYMDFAHACRREKRMQ